MKHCSLCKKEGYKIVLYNAVMNTSQYKVCSKCGQRFSGDSPISAIQVLDK